MGGWETGMGRFDFRQVEFELSFRIQGKVYSLLPVMYFLYSNFGLVLHQSITPLRTYSMIFSVMRE